MLESKYQSLVIKRLYLEFPGCIVQKNGTDFQQGFPDLTIYYGVMWAILEVKGSRDAPERPNQGYFIAKLNEMSFAAFIYPENEEDVFDALHRSFEIQRSSCLPKCKRLSLG